jgi:hypothetical protein
MILPQGRINLALPKRKFMELTNRFIIPGILFLLTLAFGFWLSHAGKP